MPGAILVNTIVLPGKRGVVEAAVRAAMDKLPGSWQAEILVNQDSAGLQIRLSRPDGKNWSRVFEGPRESEPEHIRQIIERAGL
jgi:hypothetical protein